MKATSCVLLLLLILTVSSNSTETHIETEELHEQYENSIQNMFNTSSVNTTVLHIQHFINLNIKALTYTQKNHEHSKNKNCSYSSCVSAIMNCVSNCYCDLPECKCCMSCMKCVMPLIKNCCACLPFIPEYCPPLLHK